MAKEKAKEIFKKCETILKNNHFDFTKDEDCITDMRGVHGKGDLQIVVRLSGNEIKAKCVGFGKTWKGSNAVDIVNEYCRRRRKHFNS